MNKIVVEVGSTCTKVDLFDGEKIKHISTVTIEFKRNFNDNKELNENDIQKLIYLVNDIEREDNDILICGTSVFRVIDEEQKNNFLMRFKNETGLDFNIISQDEENRLTVLGATRKLNRDAIVFVGGGASTEISYFDKEIKSMFNTKLGVMDILKEYPDLGEDIATSDLEKVKETISSKLNVPDIKCDTLILAGGGHQYFARYSGVRYTDNTLFNDENESIMMDIKTRIEDTKRYYKEISLDEIRSKAEDPAWWYATRAMCAFVLVVADKVEAKYVIPTDISMIYGLI